MVSSQHKTYSWPKEKLGTHYRLLIVTGRNEFVAKVMFLVMSVILLTGGGLPQCMLGYHPPEEDNPLPKKESPGPPPGIQSMSGRYASYWNAFLLPPANEVWGKVIFLHLFVILFTGGHAWFYSGGHAWFYSGGMHGFIQGCVCGFIRGHVWFYLGGMCGFIWGACMVLFREHAWFYLGGMHGFIQGGMCGFIRGACVVLFGGACVVFSVLSDTMRYGQWAGGTHPTGMHSCLVLIVRESL